MRHKRFMNRALEAKMAGLVLSLAFVNGVALAQDSTANPGTGVAPLPIDLPGAAPENGPMLNGPAASSPGASGGATKTPMTRASGSTPAATMSPSRPAGTAASSNSVTTGNTPSATEAANKDAAKPATTTAPASDAAAAGTPATAAGSGAATTPPTAAGDGAAATPPTAAGDGAAAGTSPTATGDGAAPAANDGQSPADGATAGASDAAAASAGAAASTTEAGHDPSAETPGTLKSTRTYDDYDRPSGLGWSLFLGLDAGYGNSGAAREVQESVKRGYQAALRLTPVVSAGRIDMNFGLGYMFSYLKAQNNDGEHLLGSSDNKRIRGTSIETRLGFFFLNPMVALNSSWSIGPMGLWLFGTDATFSAKVGKDEQTVFGGLNLYYRRQDSRYLYRYGLQYLIDVNIDQRRIQMINLSAEIGLPLRRRKTIVEESVYENSKEHVEQATVEKPVEAVTVKEDLSFVIDAQYINFVTAKAELTPLSQRRLTRLGQYLAQNPGMWMGLTVEGHTDKRGSRPYNQKLSDARAKSVVNALVAAGAPPERLIAKGYGFDRPLDRGNTPVALARNRRVEFRFDGVRDEGQLQSQLFRTLRSD